MVLSEEVKINTLARVRYGNKAPFFPDAFPGTTMGLTGTEEAMMEEGLLELKDFQTKPNMNRDSFQGRILACTEEGEKLLHEDLLRLVLLLVRLEVYTYNKEFYDVIHRLSKEELPELLTHEKIFVRLAAIARMEELKPLNLPTP